MKKVSSTEAIRRGFSILGSVSRSPMSSRDIFQRLYDDGFNVSIRTIERDLSRLPDIFPSLIEVDDRSKPFTYRQPINARKYSAMNPSPKYPAALELSLLTPLINLIIEGLFMEYIFLRSFAVLFDMFFSFTN